jgi:hypothetical protein
MQRGLGYPWLPADVRNRRYRLLRDKGDRLTATPRFFHRSGPFRTKADRKTLIRICRFLNADYLAKAARGCYRATNTRPPRSISGRDPRKDGYFRGALVDEAEASREISRDRHLFGPGPKRILSLDGGGVRGAISVAFLERIEALLQQRHGENFCLGEYFDFVAGTSTGAIIGCALALGIPMPQIKNFYLEVSASAFKRQRWSVPILRAKFDARSLRREIEAVVGSRTLSSADLITGLCIVAKRMDTGRPWIISNNPRAPYWEDSEGFIGNKHYSLVNIIRASTAAPQFFDPELLPIVPTEALPEVLAKPLEASRAGRALRALLQKVGLGKRVNIDPNKYGLFIDGGISPHNNPALAVFQMATLSPFNIKWPTGPDRLTVISIGTGTYRKQLSYEMLGFARYFKLAIHALSSLVTDAEMQVLMLMQWMGECPSPWQINSEMGDLGNDAPPGGNLFRFLRYDVKLEKDWLERELNCRVNDDLLERLRGMDDVRLVHDLYKIGCIAAEKQVRAEHFPG